MVHKLRHWPDAGWAKMLRALSKLCYGLAMLCFVAISLAGIARW
jgi:hypothetical protein